MCGWASTRAEVSSILGREIQGCDDQEFCAEAANDRMMCFNASLQNP